MRNLSMIVKSLRTVLFLVFWLDPGPAPAVDFVIGYSFGCSSNVEEQRYDLFP